MDTFNRSNIYDTIFFNVTSVTEYPNLESFIENDIDSYDIWESMAKKRYAKELEEGIGLNELYLSKACFLPEFSKVVAITYATAKSENGKIVKNIEKIDGANEAELLYGFCLLLDIKFGEYINNRNGLTLAGHNITGHDIPLLVKRIVKYRSALAQERSSVVPIILKNYLKAKPWDSNVLDTINMWKFNGTDYISLNLISEFIGLKKKIKLMEMDELNRYYWENIEKNSEETLTTITRQSGSFTNIAYQLVDTLRQL